MEENNLCELEIEEGGSRIRLKKNSSDQPVIISQMHNTPNQPSTAPAVKEQKKLNNIEIKSPMVGTFYRAPSPGAKPYVEIGSTVKPGDVVCIIEAMKLMNEIKAETSGKITEILLENGEPVEFGQPLFHIEPL